MHCSPSPCLNGGYPIRMESTATLARVWRGTVEITVKRVSLNYGIPIKYVCHKI